jgi:hypothetical protein
MSVPGDAIAVGPCDETGVPLAPPPLVATRATHDDVFVRAMPGRTVHVLCPGYDYVAGLEARDCEVTVVCNGARHAHVRGEAVACGARVGRVALELRSGSDDAGILYRRFRLPPRHTE